jgi:hypothetical protein
MKHRSQALPIAALLSLFNFKGRIMTIHNKPCAAHGLTSYRYSGAYGWIMIGATDHADALREAQRSMRHDTATLDKLQVWNRTQYEGGL